LIMQVQIITPHVLQWIATQARAGHKREAVLAAMCSSGWKEDVARLAIEQAKRGATRKKSGSK